MTFPTSPKCKHRSMISHIRVTLTRAITETLGTESMQQFYEQSIPHPSGDTLSIDGDSCSSSSTPTIPSRARYHLQWNPVPCARAKQSCTHCPGAKDIISKPQKRCGATVRRLAFTSLTPRQHFRDSTVWPKQRLAPIHSGSLPPLIAPIDSWIVRLVTASTFL